MSRATITLGCHNLTGGSSFMRSQRLVRCALDLGITRFDVAPSYGMGTAEKMLSRALGHARHDQRIEITTKFGIEPTRFGAIKSLLREPYRFAKDAFGKPKIPSEMHMANQNVRIFDHANHKTFPSTIQESFHRSLRDLRVDYISAFLSHEDLSFDLDASFKDFAEDLTVSKKLIGKVGCSGALECVLRHLGTLGGLGQVAQISVISASEVGNFPDRRFFNISRLANFIASFAASPENKITLDHLSDASESNFLTDRCSQLSSAIVLCQTNLPGSTIIVNASSADRLYSLISNSIRPSMQKWSEDFSQNFEFKKICRAVLNESVFPR
jgi:hypothetical protein